MSIEMKPEIELLYASYLIDSGLDAWPKLSKEARQLYLNDLSLILVGKNNAFYGGHNLKTNFKLLIGFRHLI